MLKPVVSSVLAFERISEQERMYSAAWTFSKIVVICFHTGNLSMILTGIKALYLWNITVYQFKSLWLKFTVCPMLMTFFFAKECTTSATILNVSQTIDHKLDAIWPGLILTNDLDTNLKPVLMGPSVQVISCLYRR